VGEGRDAAKRTEGTVLGEDRVRRVNVGPVRGGVALNDATFQSDVASTANYVNPAAVVRRHIAGDRAVLYHQRSGHVVKDHTAADPSAAVGICGVAGNGAVADGQSARGKRTRHIYAAATEAIDAAHISRYGAAVQQQIILGEESS